MKEEVYDRVPKISSYYKNYSKFFCNPLFRDFSVNKLIQVYGENKGELYYKINYASKKIGTNSNIDTTKIILNNVNFNDKNDDLKRMFNTTINDKINNNSVTKINDSTLILHNSSLNYKVSTRDSPNFMNDISSLALDSDVKTYRSNEASVRCNIDISLKMNVLEISIEEKIIEKILKSKKLSQIFLKNDEIKEKKEKKNILENKKKDAVLKYKKCETMPSIVQIIIMKNNFKTIDNLNEHKNLLKKYKKSKEKIIKQKYKTSKNDEINFLTIIKDKIKIKKLGEIKISTLIKNDNLKSPKILSSKIKIDTNFKESVDKIVKLNLKSPKNIINNQLRLIKIRDYKINKIEKPTNLELKPKNILSKIFKDRNQNENRNIYLPTTPNILCKNISDFQNNFFENEKVKEKNLIFKNKNYVCGKTRNNNADLNFKSNSNNNSSKMSIFENKTSIFEKE